MLPMWMLPLSWSPCLSRLSSLPRSLLFWVLLSFRRAPSLLPLFFSESVSPAWCRRVGLVSWSKGGRGVGWMGRCGVLDGVFGVLSPGLMRISVKKMVLRSFLRLGGGLP